MSLQCYSEVILIRIHHLYSAELLNFGLFSTTYIYIKTISQSHMDSDYVVHIIYELSNEQILQVQEAEKDD